MRWIKFGFVTASLSRSEGMSYVGAKNRVYQQRHLRVQHRSVRENDRVCVEKFMPFTFIIFWRSQSAFDVKLRRVLLKIKSRTRVVDSWGRGVTKVSGRVTRQCDMHMYINDMNPETKGVPGDAGGIRDLSTQYR